MDNALFPTKGNLILARNTLALSNQGYDLLDKKRSILVREVMDLMDEAKAVQGMIAVTFAEAYKALQEANLTIGINTVEQISEAIEEENGIEIKVRSIMGVEMPTIKDISGAIDPQYGFARTNMSLDEAFAMFVKVKKLTLELAEVENAIFRLAINIKRTQKRANALKNILIPNYEGITKYIVNALEEKEREEFTRLKMIKKSR